MLDLATDGASMATAAAVFEIPQGTACTRLRRARAAVRAFFEREARGERRANGRSRMQGTESTGAGERAAASAAGAGGGA